MVGSITSWSCAAALHESIFIYQSCPSKSDCNLIGYPAHPVKSNQFQIVDWCRASEHIPIHRVAWLGSAGPASTYSGRSKLSHYHTTTSSCGCLERLQTKAVDEARFSLAPPTDFGGLTDNINSRSAATQDHEKIEDVKK